MKRYLPLIISVSLIFNGCVTNALWKNEIDKWQETQADGIYKSIEEKHLPHYLLRYYSSSADGIQKSEYLAMKPPYANYNFLNAILNASVDLEVTSIKVFVESKSQIDFAIYFKSIKSMDIGLVDDAFDSEAKRIYFSFDGKKDFKTVEVLRDKKGSYFKLYNIPVYPIDDDNENFVKLLSTDYEEISKQSYPIKFYSKTVKDTEIGKGGLAAKVIFTPLALAFDAILVAGAVVLFMLEIICMH